MSKSSIGKCFKPIIQYDLEGNFIREWKSATEVNNILQLNKTNILSVCKQRSKTAFGFIWRYKNDPLPENYKLSKFDKNKKEIIQYNKLGEKIKTWNSITEASINLQINNTDISDCCLGKQKTSHGFIWRYKNDPLPENYKLPKNKGRSINQYDLNGEFIKTYDRISDVKENFKFDISGINQCIRGKQKTAYGFKWEYKIKNK